MGLFGNNDDKQRDNDALVAEVQRLDALPYEALATEILQRVFAPGAAGSVQPHEAIAAVSPTDRIFGIDAEASAALTDLVYEGLHLLYRAGLLTWSFSGGDHASMSWDLSRAGRRALEQGTVGVALEGCAPKVP